jgi:hypothetical protein
VRDNDTPVLKIGEATHVLTQSDMNRLNLALSDNSLTDDQRKQRVASVINGIALNTQMSQNYQQGISSLQNPTENLSIK